MRWALLDPAMVVRSIVDSDEKPAGAVATSDGDGCSIGKVWNGWSFQAPSWSSYEFLGRFTEQELSACLLRSQTDPTLRLFILYCEAAHSVFADDSITLLGMDYLVQANLLSSARRDQILSA